MRKKSLGGWELQLSSTKEIEKNGGGNFIEFFGPVILRAQYFMGE